MTKNVVIARKHLNQGMMVTITWGIELHKKKIFIDLIMIWQDFLYFFLLRYQYCLFVMVTNMHVQSLPCSKCFLANHTFFVIFNQLLIFLTIGLVFCDGFVAENFKTVIALHLFLFDNWLNAFIIRI